MHPALKLNLDGFEFRNHSLFRSNPPYGEGSALVASPTVVVKPRKVKVSGFPSPRCFRSRADHWPSSDTPAFSHFRIRAKYPPIGHPVFDELHRPFVTQVIEEAADVGIEHPVHPLPLDAHRQRVQRLMRAATGTEPVREALEVDPVGLFHPLQHAGLSRRSPDCPSLRINRSSIAT